LIFFFFLLVVVVVLGFELRARHLVCTIWATHQPLS
jgi:hypothetical protein